MHAPSAPTAICLVTDRLSAGMLGAYGNCWVGTPSFDRLASSALVADQMLLTSPRLGDFYRSIWQSGHESEQSGHIAEIFSDRGSASLLITDDAEVESIGKIDLHAVALSIPVQTINRAMFREQRQKISFPARPTS